MATFLAIVDSTIVFPLTVRSCAGGRCDTHSLDALFTPHGFVTMAWTGSTVISDYINGQTVPKRNAVCGELGFVITHDEKVYSLDLWKEEHIPKNASPISMMPVYHGKGCYNAICSPVSMDAAIRTAFHLCENDIPKALKLLARRFNICVEDYIWMDISDIAKRLRDEGKAKDPLVLDPIRFSEAD